VSSMQKYYRERFEAQRRLAGKIAPHMEVNRILEIMRSEIRALVPRAMEACILLLDPEAGKYTRPLQCALYDRPVNCLSCKRNRSAIQKAIKQQKGVVVSSSDPIVRMDGSRVEVGPEAAIPVFSNGDVLAVVSVVSLPGTRFSRKDFYLLQDISEVLRNILLSAKAHWETTQEKIRISQMLAHLSPFVPESVRSMVEKDPDMLEKGKEKRDVSVLFLDLEDYTRLSVSRPDTEMNDLVERMFSSFVDPIHRSHGDINETAGDGLMIIFKNDDARTNAANSVQAAFDIRERSLAVNRDLELDLGPVNVNMGINSGTALVGMTRFKGSLQTRMTYTASGPVTNLAARLASHARGGDMLMGPETKKLIAGFWPVYDRGLIRLKGVEEPIHVYSLLEGGPPAA